MKKFNAFTLAEVLITLGIIGVVATMTIPNIVKIYQKQVTVTRVKSAYSQLLQAIQLSEIDNGPIKNWQYSTTQAFVSSYIQPYYKGMKLCAIGTDKSCGTAPWSSGRTYITPNGISFSFLVISGYFDVQIDINPQKAKYNKSVAGKDVFYFSNDNYTNDNQSRKLKPWGWTEGVKREDCLNGRLRLGGGCIKGATGIKRCGCTLLLMLDGWEMKNDYPW